MSLRVVFMGTPDFAVPSLSALSNEFDVALVLTMPDAVRGRGKDSIASPVKKHALDLGIRVIEAKRIGATEIARIREVAPDVIAVAAYGAILPDEILSTDLARFGAINVHGSLLPRWRGAAPIQRAILADDEHIGISIMRIAHELDAGPWCRQASIDPQGLSAVEITQRLAELGAAELVEAIHEMEAGTDRWTEQDIVQVCYAKKISKAEMRLTPADDAHTNLLRIRAATDAAPARAMVCGRGVRILRALAAPTVHIAAGEVLLDGARLFLGCADDALELLLVKPDGKREMSVSAWVAGLRGDLVWGDR